MERELVLGETRAHQQDHLSSLHVPSLAELILAERLHEVVVQPVCAQVEVASEGGAVVVHQHKALVAAEAAEERCVADQRLADRRAALDHEVHSDGGVVEVYVVEVAAHLGVVLVAQHLYFALVVVAATGVDDGLVGLERVGDLEGGEDIQAETDAGGFRALLGGVLGYFGERQTVDGDFGDWRRILDSLLEVGGKRDALVLVVLCS